jgi:hypothetical protein
MKRLLFALMLVGCHEKQEVTPPPPPLRPDPEPSPPKRTAVEKDCEKTDDAHELKAFTFEQRSIPEAIHLATDGAASLASGNDTANDKRTRESYMSQAVKQFLEALGADPYNVSATYSLAAAYAKIGRPQCSLNLLTRLIQMRTHPSKKPEVEAALDKLLGRNKQALDPNFADMRADERFRTLISKMCEGTNDPNCVYGNH